jgi:zinc and cadmium transporter
MAYWLLVAYCVLILFASLAGGALPLVFRFTHATMQFSVSFVSGVMLGAGFLHMLPHALDKLRDPQQTMLWVLAGFLLMFFIQRFLAVHQHVSPHEQTASEHQCGESDEAHHHAHEDVPSSRRTELMADTMSWGGAVLGFSLHSLLNGVALAAAVEARAGLDSWPGAAVFLAVAIHKPFDSLTITTLMTAAGWSRRICHLINALFSLAIPLGVALFYLGVAAAGSSILGFALAVSAGVFLCIAASDLLPEMQFHSHDRGYLSVCLLAGVGLAFLLEH